ncbi:MAG: TMEM165/GDT1 family protein [Chlorobiales bacterium]|nr:TMEM165/GDT1 family protein [Chlorobiales bacterium]
MEAFSLSFAMIFIAELGDKSQLLALTLATCFSARVVLSAIFCSTLAVHVLSTAAGALLGGLFPVDWVLFLAGISFIVYGFWTLRGDSLEEDSDSCKPTIHPFWLVFSTFFIAELGDKTMLSSLSLATTNPFMAVWIGSTLGMVFSDALAIAVGKVLGKKLPENIVKIGAAIIFFAFGAFSMYEGGADFDFMLWAAALCLIGLSGYLFLRKPS